MDSTIVSYQVNNGINFYYGVNIMTTLNQAQYNTLVTKGLKAQDHSLSGFAEACYDDGGFEELVTALDSEADTIDCKAWDIDAQGWKESIKQALEFAMYWYEDENA